MNEKPVNPTVNKSGRVNVLHDTVSPSGLENCVIVFSVSTGFDFLVAYFYKRKKMIDGQLQYIQIYAKLHNVIAIKGRNKYLLPKGSYPDSFFWRTQISKYFMPFSVIM